jgi:methylated-DNA-[protein]-cysteine S-methyltransferase
MSPTPDRYQLFDTALGTCGLAWNAAGVTRVQLPERDAAATEARLRRRPAEPDTTPPPEIVAAIDRLRRYATGERIDFQQLPLDMGGLGDFEIAIYRTLRAVPYGTTTTYGALAAAIREPTAARAVGVAMARNPWPVVVPCHRVLAAKQEIGGFSAFGGTATKAKLLALEGVALDNGQPMLPGL